MATLTGLDGAPVDSAEQEVQHEMEKRIRVPTEKARENYEEKVFKLTSDIRRSWDKVQIEIDKAVNCETLEELKNYQRSLCLIYGEYRLLSRRYVTYLEEVYTHDSIRRLNDFWVMDRTNDGSVNSTLTQTDLKIESLQLETRTVLSTTSRSSSTKSLATRAKVKYRAAMARMTLINKETELKKKQIDIESDLKALKEEQILEEAKAEVEVYIEESVSEPASRQSDLDTNRKTALGPTQDARERTRDYVASLSNNTDIPSEEVSNVPNSVISPTNNKLTNELNPDATEFKCGEVKSDVTSELSKFLLRKDLLFSRLTKYDDKPENYSVWKSTFKSVVLELGVGVREELDLLVKWLGHDSVRYAISLRASSSSNPETGIQKLWQRLDERFGSPEIVEVSLRKKIENFPTLGYKDSKKLYDLSDVLDEIQNNMENPKYRDLLSFYNTSLGVNPVVRKLPHNLQERWTTHASKYKQQHSVPYPPFTFFCEFVRDMSKIRNDPSFAPSNQAPANKRMSALKTEVHVVSSRPEMLTSSQQAVILCQFHNVHGHSLNTCRTFRSKPFSVRRKFIREKNICFKCCEESDHIASKCKKSISCNACQGPHATALHFNTQSASAVNGGEISKTHSGQEKKREINQISTACNKLCSGQTGGRSCAKVVCVNVYSKTDPQHKIKMYALLDDQSNRSLAKPEFFDSFEETFDEVPYSLSSCAGTVHMYGRRAAGFVVENLDGTRSHDLPALTECSQIPDLRSEIPTPDVARAYSHLKNLAENIPERDEHAPVLLLIGRDLSEAHHVLKQRLGPKGHPFAQEFSLGWVIIGETCLGKVHTPSSVCVNKTYVHSGNRTSIFPPCENRLFMKDRANSVDQISKDVFVCTPEDNKKGLSAEDEEFLNIMEEEFTKSSDGHWSAPLPFRTPRARLPNNRDQALKRANSLQASLKKNPQKQEHFVEFMHKIFENGFAEIATPLQADEESWYLPIFGVYHAKKKGQIRVVFDSAAQYQGVSLNSVLLQGPNLMNSLLGVLMRFRNLPVAVTVDIQQMFFQFRVHERHRNYLRFIWFKDNNPNSELVEYRMCSHVFGNSPSPSIASYGLQKTVAEMEPVYGSDVREFVEKDFYVDDGLSSFPDADTAIDVLTRTRQALKEGGNLRLHKIASNDKEVMKAFPRDDLAKDLQDVSIEFGTLPTQRSLGMDWDLNTDSFKFTVSREVKPLTRRGVLSTINAIFDPLGFVGPVVVQGKILMRDLLQETVDWDQPLSVPSTKLWNEWKKSLEELEQIRIPRMYIPTSVSFENQEIHIFSDASEKAVASVAYMRGNDDNGAHQVGFVLGKSKVAPQTGHTIPRLELCAAVMSVEIAEIISEQLGFPIGKMKFYTDSQVVLGYLNNKVRRFYIYVQNRVSRILKLTARDQWYYVSTQENPADQGTRPIAASSLQCSAWLTGPEFLKYTDQQPIAKTHELQFPGEDREIRPIVQCLKTVSEIKQGFKLDRFTGINRWKLLIKVIALLKLKARCIKVKDTNPSSSDQRVEILKESERFILRSVQQECFSHELQSLSSKRELPRNSSIQGLNPFLDEHDLLRVGGRLRNASDLSTNEKHPVILPKGHFVSRLVATNYHEKVCHQGFHFTEGAIRSSGFWIVGVKRLVRSIIQDCVKCRKLRGKASSQIMADLPEDRLTSGAPFSSVGVDVFGPWNVVARRTRGGVSHSKRWAVIYTCLTIRAIHIEVVEELSTSSFINATRRFFAMRGPVQVFRSDRGTNFVGATDCMKIDAVNVEDRQVTNFMDNNQTVWIFNSPHSSHMGGVWERLIGVVRRILNSMMADLSRDLTHEVLTTYMAEICTIVNSRPLVQVSVDPNNPVVLSPAMLLTQKPIEEGQYLSEISVKDMYKAQWRQVQCLSNMFWKRWKTEFLQTLQQRKKWSTIERDFSIGDIVLLIEDNAPRNYWPMGVITEVFPSNDGHVRKVMVRVSHKGDTESRSYVRPITKLISLLESDDKCE